MPIEEKTGKKRFTYIGIARDCPGCHKNIHKSRDIEECTDCHGQSDWKKITFDHDTQTEYKLEGLHSDSACKKCHKKKGSEKKIRDFTVANYKKCLTCHKDTHKGRLSSHCLDCHNLKGWKILDFSHDDSKYPLKGAHKKVPCQDCHDNKKYTGLRFNKCSDCHKETPHNKLHEPCTSCHMEKGWKNMVKRWDTNAADHNRYRYKLKGAHVKVKCKKCHSINNKPVYFKMKYKKCSDCHEDEHKGQFKGQRCEDCHIVKDFKKVTPFDHEKTDFKLEVLHKDIKCEKCHEDDRYTPVPVSCEQCNNDITRYYRGMTKNYAHPSLASPKSRLVACEDCHETTIKDFEVDAQVCLDCHEKPYEQFFNTWNEYLDNEIALTDEKLDTLSFCQNLTFEDLEAIEEKKIELEFLKKNMYHNYRLTGKLIKDYQTFYNELSM